MFFKKRKKVKSLEDRILDGFIYLILILLCIATIYPFWYIFVVSLSAPDEVAKAGASLIWPKGFNLSAYKSVLMNPRILIGFRNSVMYVVLGTLISLILTTLCAYPLSRKNLPGKKILMIFIMITMYFGGGLIPSFLLIQKLGMYNTIWAVIIPGALSTWNMLMMRSFFANLPSELEEAAKIDGANDLQILIKVVLPISVPIIAVMGLFYAVAIWNSWFGASIYLIDKDLHPIQLILRQILVQGNTASISNVSGGTSTPQIAKTLKFATAIISTVPILIVYPFIQKYFVKGIMLGSLKE